MPQAIAELGVPGTQQAGVRSSCMPPGKSKRTRKKKKKTWKAQERRSDHRASIRASNIDQPERDYSWFCVRNRVVETPLIMAFRRYWGLGGEPGEPEIFFSARKCHKKPTRYNNIAARVVFTRSRSLVGFSSEEAQRILRKFSEKSQKNRLLCVYVYPLLYRSARHWCTHLRRGYA